MEVLSIKKIIYSHRLLFILSTALLTTAALTVLTSLTGFLKQSPKSITIIEQNGIFDLTGISSLDEIVIRLPHGEVYYPSTYLMPDSLNSSTPVSTHLFDTIRADYLSQRFVLKVPEGNSAYALTFTLSGRHAMRVYVNGELTAQTGQLGRTKRVSSTTGTE